MDNRWSEKRIHQRGKGCDRGYGVDILNLGVQGDYEGLYAWLGEHRAKECGDSVAVFLVFV